MKSVAILCLALLSAVFSGVSQGEVELPVKADADVPTSGDPNAPAAAFDITNRGSGGVASFTTENPTASDEAVLRLQTDGNNNALEVKTTGRGGGASFVTENSASRAHTVEIETDAAAAALRVEASGFGTGVEAVSKGSGPAVNVRGNTGGNTGDRPRFPLILGFPCSKTGETVVGK
jgi:hypothetical protein